MPFACYNVRLRCNYTSAGMAELVDARDSKSRVGDNVGVRFPLPAPLVLFKRIKFKFAKWQAQTKAATFVTKCKFLLVGLSFLCYFLICVKMTHVKKL